MTRSVRCAFTLALIGLEALPVASQQGGKQPADPVIRVSVDLVQVDAVVTDSKGHHVADLTAEDFAILEDGKRQKITHFSYVRGSVIPSAPANIPPKSNQRRETQTEANVAPAKVLRQDEVQRTIVLIADDLGLASDDIPAVRRAMKNFVDRNMEAGDLVSVMTTSGGTSAMAQLTNDKRRLYASIDRIHWSPARSMLTWYEPVHSIDRFTPIENTSNRRINSIRRPFLGGGTLSALAYAIQGLREMPGRKAIALFSDGFPQPAGGVVELANRASVVIYTLDPRGLASFFLTAVDFCKPPWCSVKTEETRREALYRASQRGLDELARETGGIFFHDNNDLDQGLATALDDMGSYYLIGYQPRRDDFDRVRGNLQFHRIDVKVLRPGVSVRSRHGFLGLPDPVGLEPASAVSRKDQLRRALFSPFEANGFEVHLSAFYSADAEKDPKSGRRPAWLRAMLAIDTRGLTFKDAAAGAKQLDLDVVLAAYTVTNELAASSDKTFSATMTPDEINQIVASGLLYEMEIPILKPGPYQLRVAARDANSLRVGSAASFVEIPDFNGPAVALSSVLLHDSDPKRNDALTREGVIGAGSPVTRVFGPGAALDYDCTVFGARIDKQTEKPRIDIEMRLFRGPERIFTGQPIPLAIADGSSKAAIHATGEIKLPASLPPGDYALELSAYDRLAPTKLQRASQWVDFTLAK